MIKTLISDSKIPMISDKEKARLEEILVIRAAKLKQHQIIASNIFMGLIIIVGIVTFFISWNTDKDLQTESCASTSIKTANKLVLCLSTAMIICPILFWVGNCENPESIHYKWYIYMSLVLGILLLVLGSIISHESTKNKCKVGSHPEWIWILGLIITIFSVGIIYYINKK